MPLWGIVLVILGTLLIFSVIHYVSKNKRPIRRAFLSMVIGISTLFAVNLSAGLTGVYLPISLLSILTSLIGGVPGVTLMLGLNLYY